MVTHYVIGAPACAAALGVSLRNLRRMLADGAPVVQRFPGGRLELDPQAIATWHAARHGLPVPGPLPVAPPPAARTPSAAPLPGPAPASPAAAPAPPVAPPPAAAPTPPVPLPSDPELVREAVLGVLFNVAMDPLSGTRARLSAATAALRHLGRPPARSKPLADLLAGDPEALAQDLLGPDA